MAESVIKKDIIVEPQIIPVSGFDGNARETQLTIPNVRRGYTPFLINVVPSTFNTTHYIFMFGNINSLGKFYVEHNLTSAVTQITAYILWVKS